MEAEDETTLGVVSLLIVPRMIYHMAIENEFRGNHAMATNCMDSGTDQWSVHKMVYVVLDPVDFAVSAFLRNFAAKLFLDFRAIVFR